MNETLELSKMVGLLVPLIILQLILMIIALVLCVKTEETRGPKLMWVLIIIFGQLIGPIAFFLFGRRQA
ncbi:PLDc_N domain-containing protein [Paenibacillus pinisoli]|uniref:PLDc_N domain-containing protein n=1 Tax=Paenibacillus pinisoli TaxID=1276110 RepID=A0A3A6PPY9_9BACL|nr:PLD nuclease N-terminal domain-containing protein [Paenibacillus pinisoli]RJX38641.1 PLDc_N domain-containing protein [Paenibacillus pinisoli]